MRRVRRTLDSNSGRGGAGSTGREGFGRQHERSNSAGVAEDVGEAAMMPGAAVRRGKPPCSDQPRATRSPGTLASVQRIRSLVMTGGIAASIPGSPFEALVGSVAGEIDERGQGLFHFGPR